MLHTLRPSTGADPATPALGAPPSLGAPSLGRLGLRPGLVLRLCLSLWLSLAGAAPAWAQILKIEETAFRPGAGRITFSELPVETRNPAYPPSAYRDGQGAPTVSFGGHFAGQSPGTARICPRGAAVTGCVTGRPSAPLRLAPGSPTTYITGDGANPTSPVLSGSPRFNGPIAILFSSDVAGVGLSGGYFDSVGGTAIEAFDRQGRSLGVVANEALGIEFLGLVTRDGSERIAGLLFSIVGAERDGFAIDNLRFARTEQVAVPGEPEPAPRDPPRPRVLQPF